MSSSSLLVVAWVLSIAQAFLDFGSRSARISAIPALAALQICIVVILVLLAAVVFRKIEARKVQASRKLSDWPLAIALGASLCALLGRVAISPFEPTVFWLGPLLLVTPALLTWEVAVMYRSGRRLTGRTERFVLLHSFSAQSDGIRYTFAPLAFTGFAGAC
ncbi:MAG: hypothetical protein NTX58_12990 [Actinobacteria bacterium]|nr:hypothetical protein [Actinomycetota bacterium]